MTQFTYPLPFGANLIDEGAVRFRLWAPGQDEVALALNGSDTTQPLAPAGNGWFELVTDRARPGSTYSFVLADGSRVPDPGARAQQNDVHDPSIVIDPRAYDWRHGDWIGRPWEEAIISELHVGALTPEGNFDGVRGRLDHFVRTGITAIELMPVADFSGRRGWGYDGVLPFAPDRTYGAPEDLKRLIDEAHSRGLMVFLDVVYNHFGPDGNYLHLLAPQFFTERHHTPWGAAIDFGRREVRDFFIANALYWLDEYRFDGLRFDAVHAIIDDSEPHFLVELAEAVHRTISSRRHVHLILENDANQTRYLRREADGSAPLYRAQWNDDYHHVVHTMLTSEDDGYYGDYADDPTGRLTRALIEGFVYQGEPSPHRNGLPRGEPSAQLPPTAMVNFLQNHDQIGNRAFGDRLATLAPPEAVRAALAILLLAPQIPMLYMGEEWEAEEPFLFFCDFHDELAEAVREGRRREFAGFARFADPKARAAIPDPNDPTTFERSKLDWSKSDSQRLADVCRLVELRRERIIPHLAGTKAVAATAGHMGGGIAAAWTLGNGARLSLLANLTATPVSTTSLPHGETLFATHPGLRDAAVAGRLPPWSALWCLDSARTAGG